MEGGSAIQLINGVQGPETPGANTSLISARKDQKGYSALGDAEAQTSSAASSVAVGLPGVCLCILIVELCERLAFYTFTGTQEPFLENGGFTLSQSAGINAAMATLCMTWSLVACWSADVGIGRYNTILSFGLLYALGAMVAAISAWPGIGSIRCYLAAVIVLVPIGTAGIKANISNFGADQYDITTPSGRAAQEKFFSWFYLSINLGSAVAYGYLTTLASNGGLGIPKTHGYFAAYAIAAACMFLAVCLFRAGRSQYQVRPCQEQWAMFSVVHYVVAAARAGSSQAIALSVGCIALAAGIILSVVQAIWPQAAFATVVMGAAFVCASVGVVATVLPCLNPTWLDGVDLQGESLSNSDVKTFLTLLPVLITANLAFGALYNSMQYWYQQQACQMDLRVPFINVSGGQLAGSFFMIADCLAIVLATPLAIGWLNPWIEQRTGGRFNHTAKFGLGMCFGVLSVMIAARFEMVRRGVEVLGIASNCAPAGINMSAMSAAWMIFPFFFMGVGEIYTQPVLMHFAYTRSPPSMQTLVVAINFLIGAVSNSIFTVQITALSSFVPNDLNQGHLEFGYLSNILVGISFYVAYVYCAGRLPETRPVTE